MSFRAMVLGLVLLSALPALARDKTDVLIMKNGDRMTCEVKGLESGVLYVSFDYIDGTTKLDWGKVAHLESNQLFFVKTEDGTVYTGTLTAEQNAVGRPVMIKVIEGPNQESEIPRAQIVELIGTSDKFFERFNGAVSMGMIYSKGNQSTQYNLGSQATYDRERWNAGVNFESNLSSNSGSTTSTRNSLTLGARRLMRHNNWFYAGLASFLQSSEQGIARQSMAGGGIGRYLVNNNKASISLIAGAAWQRTDYDQTSVLAPTQNGATALFYTDVKLFKFKKTAFDLNATFLPSLSDAGRIRFDTNATYYIKIISDLKWNFSFYGNWDNRPPPGFVGSDYGTSSGLTWTFGLK